MFRTASGANYSPIVAEGQRARICTLVDQWVGHSCLLLLLLLAEAGAPPAAAPPLQCLRIFPLDSMSSVLYI